MRWFSLAFVLSACASEPFLPTYSGVRVHVFETYCTEAGCHGAGAESGLDLRGAESYARLVGVAATGMPTYPLVAPGRPDSSYVLAKLRSVPMVGERMPLGRSALPDSVIGLLKRWIEAGALQE